MSASVPLLPSQQEAIANIRAQGQALKKDAVDLISSVLRMSNLPQSALDDTRLSLAQHARVALHFHPDRPAGDRVVVRGLLEDGIYRSQFETGISNGSVSAHAGGARDEWERKLFGGAYHRARLEHAHRPKYGALDLMRNPEGPAPRFGSCYFVLKQEVSQRSTFTFGGSQDDPKYRGTADEFDAVLGALMEESFVRDFALGVGNMRPTQLIERIRGLKAPLSDQRDTRPIRNLDHMIEAQIHGDVRLDRDVAALVADPSFIGGEVGRDLEALCEKYGFPLYFHHGFEMRVDDVPLDFRGPSMPSLAARVARGGVVDAEAIGIAVRELAKDPAKWSERGSKAQVLQELKLLWHVLVRYGEPIKRRE